MGTAKGTEGTTSCDGQLARVPRGKGEGGRGKGKREEDGSSSALTEEVNRWVKSTLVTEIIPFGSARTLRP